MTSALNPMQELNFRAWAQGEGVQPTDDMRRMWMNPKGFDTGGVVNDIKYPYPLDPAQIPGSGVDFLGDGTLEKMVDNILAVYDDTVGHNSWFREAGKTWYPAAREWIERILQITGRTDIPPDTAISMVAQLSENAKWPENMRFFMQYLQGEKPGTFNSTVDVVKRIEAADDPTMAGRGQKIYNFLRSIAGDENAVAVDRWAMRIAMGVSDQPDLWSKAETITGRSKYPGLQPKGGKWSRGYDLVQEAFQIAAERRGVIPSEMQAVTWVRNGATDSSIRAFEDLGKWRFPVTNSEVSRLALQSIAENEGVTIDISAFQPDEGYGFAPKKSTEKIFEPGELTPEALDDFIDLHYKDLRKPGNYLGGWADSTDGRVYLDVSRVGTGPETIAAAQKAKQLAVYDLGAPGEVAELQIGTIDGKGKYTPLDTPENLHNTHQVEVEKARAAAEPVPEPEPPPTPAKPLPKNTKPMPEREIRAPRSGPGATAAPESRSILGQVGRVAGPVLQGAGDLLTAYGIVGQAAQEGISEQLEQGHSYVQRGGVLGIPYGQAFEGPSAKAGDPSSGVVARPMTPQDQSSVAPAPSAPYDVSKIPQSTVDRAARSGNPIPGTTPSSAPSQPTTPSWLGGGVQLGEQVVVHHPSGPPTTYTLRRTGPHSYESPETIPLGPGDSVYLNGRQVR